MDQFLFDNAQAYQKLVGAFKPVAKPKDNKDGGRNTDIIIATRLRPMLEDEIAAGLIPGVLPRKSDDVNVDLHELRKTVRGTPSLNSSSFRLDKVFNSGDSTESIFEDLVQPLIPWAWGGGVSTMFAYGQTGSGKTFTVSGLQRLAASTLMDGSLDGSRNVSISILELAGNSAFDLLNSRKPVSILEDSFGSTHFAGATEHSVKDLPTLLSHIDHAASFRSTAATLKNDASSRSHAICRIRLENPAIPQSEDGLLYLIDLAGSEAARDVVAHSAERMKEAREINASLSVLKDCIRGRAMLDLVETGGKVSVKAKTHIPFRQSTLTKVLKHVFDPAGMRSCRTVVMACVNPSFADVAASKNTLKYAEMLRVPVPKRDAAAYNPSKPVTWPNDKLQEWIEKNSGSPAISGPLLAPLETGHQLLRIPVPEFVSRCLKTPGVTIDQAQAFQAKFWRLHVDSRSPASTKSKGDAKKAEQDFADSAGVSSRDSRPEMAGVPFKERIRPGMVVEWKPPYIITDGIRPLAMILSPVEGSGEGEARKYACAQVVPGFMHGSLEVYIWRQVEVSVEMMLKEVLLEYDIATRYYYETL